MHKYLRLRAQWLVLRSQKVTKVLAGHLTPFAALLACILLPLATSSCNRAGAQRDHPDGGSSPVTNIAIGRSVLRSGIKRLGVNISGQNYYDSGQILRNLTFRNPGFEGESWRSILRCKHTTPTSCTDGNQWAAWPDNFLKNAHFEFLSGPAKGLTGPIESSSKGRTVDPEAGITFNFAKLDRTPNTDDFVLVQFERPGNAQKGWWTDAAHNGSTITTEFNDLAPNSPGKQALRITAAGPSQSARVDSYFDSYNGRSFVQLKGRYRLSFRAKGVGGTQALTVGLTRTGTAKGNEVLFARTTVPLSTQWKDYTYEWTAAEDGTLVGTLDLNFTVEGANVLLDDVTVNQEAASSNPTMFRNEVVKTLKDLNPGILRYMDSGVDFASSFDNMIAPPFARQRAGYSTGATEQEDVPLGLHEFLQLCQVIGAEPWYAMPATGSPEEARHLIEYLAGSPSTPYGAKRAALGQTAPWSSVFPMIHLEYGNELWNAGTFYGAAISDPVVSGKRAAELFAGARSSPSYRADRFDLILGSQAVNSWWTQQELANSAHYDSIAVAPYLFYKLADTTSNEAIFGPMFAEPEMVDSLPSGYMAQQAKAARTASHPAKLAVYEVNLGTEAGDASQSMVNAVVPSIAAGLTVADHMLLMVRDLGITAQAAWALPQYVNKFNNPKDNAEVTPLWGMVVDMGGATNLRRPQFLAEQLANQAILPTMLETMLSGANPTWKQSRSKNNDIAIDSAHALQTFAFSDGARRSLIVFNLDRQKPLPITFSGDGKPLGTVDIKQLTAPQITDTNEQKRTMDIVPTKLQLSNGSAPYSLPPFSMTVLQWTASQ